MNTILIVIALAIIVGIAYYFLIREKVVPAVPVPEIIRDTIPATPPPVPHSMPEEEEITLTPMANFQIAYNIVADHEAGYQRLPQDRGNYNSLRQLVGTNWGINAQVYERHLGRPPSESDMRAMPKSTAISIFKQLYWDRIAGDQLPDQQVANIFLDGIINHGQGVRLMQEVLGVTPDNRYGPNTHAALISAPPRAVHDAYKNRRRQYYHHIVANDSSQNVFLRGWLRRIDSFVYVEGMPTTSGGNVLATVTIAALTYILLS